MLKRMPVIATLVGYAIQLALVIAILLHDFQNEDSEVIAWLLILAYSAIRGQIAAENGLAATWFLALHRDGEQHKEATTLWHDEPLTLKGQMLEQVTRNDVRYTWARAAFDGILATCATAKLLFLLAKFEAFIWLLISVSVLVGGWLLLEVLNLLLRSTGFPKLSTRDRIFLAPVVLVVLYVLLSLLRLVPGFDQLTHLK